MPDNAVQIVQYGSPFLGELNKLMLWSKEAGLDLYSRMRFNSKSTANREYTAQMFNSLSVDNLSQFFTLFGMCLATCTFVFFGELFWWHVISQKERERI